MQRLTKVVRVKNPGFDGEGATLTEEKVTALLEGFFAKVKTSLIDPLETRLTSLDKKVTPPPPPPPTGGGFDPNDPAYKDLPPTMVNAFKLMHESNATLSNQVKEQTQKADDAQKQVETSNLSSAIQTALIELTGNGGPAFSSPTAQATAADLLRTRTKKNEADGSYVGPDNLPLAASAKEYLTKQHAYLFKPSGQSGSGASAGGTGGGTGGSSNLGMDDIKPGMSTDEIAAISKVILSAVPKGN